MIVHSVSWPGEAGRSGVMIGTCSRVSNNSGTGLPTTHTVHISCLCVCMSLVSIHPSIRPYILSYSKAQFQNKRMDGGEGGEMKYLSKKRDEEVCSRAAGPVCM